MTDVGSLVFNHSDSQTFAPAIVGNGSVTQTGSGILTLLGDDGYSGGTTVSGGTLQVGNGGSGETLTSGTISLSNSAALVFNHSDALTYSGVIGGTGSLTKIGPGLLTLLGGSNAFTYNSGTTISGGTLQIGNGGATGNISGTIVDNAALVYNSSSNGTYAGIISGSGSLTQVGPGAVFLAASNSFSGGTIISNGSLFVNNASGLGTGPVTVNGTLVFGAPAPDVQRDHQRLRQPVGRREQQSDACGQQSVRGWGDDHRRHAASR